VTDANPDATTPPPGASPELPADVSALTYEQARDELVQVVARLEAGSEPLEASLALWERGEALAARCQQWLDGARQRLAAAQAASSDAARGTDDASETAEEDA
jgi:exodeoxyribonuclease VII small subunit